MKALFTALDDAPEDGIAYANRFMARYGGAALPGDPSYNLSMPITRLTQDLQAQQPALDQRGTEL